MLPDDDKRYAIETCRSSESVLKKWFKNKWRTISAFVDCVIISECTYFVFSDFISTAVPPNRIQHSFCDCIGNANAFAQETNITDVTQKLKRPIQL